MSTMKGTTGVDVLLASFHTLTPDEQEEALLACQQSWLRSIEADQSEASKVIGSLKRVADELGESPGIDDYKRIRKELGDEELLPVSRILRHFQGSWHRAREALDMSDVITPRRIQARFAMRRLGKVWKYTDQTLKDTIHRVAEEIGHAPQLAEFEWWREREIELAKSKGEDIHIPSSGPYRKRFGSWEGTLLHYGFSREEIEKRLERER